MVLYPNKLPESERVCSGICSNENQYTPKEIYTQVSNYLTTNI